MLKGILVDSNFVEKDFSCSKVLPCKVKICEIKWSFA